MSKRSTLFLVPANDRIFAIEADEQATRELEAGVDLDSIKVKGKVIDHAVVVRFEEGKVVHVNV